MLFNQLARRLGLDIAHHHHRHQVGAVPVFVKTLDGVMAETLEALLGSDRQPFGVQRAAEYFGQQDFVHAVLYTLAQAQLFEHDGALLVGISIVEADALCPVLQHQKTLFNMLRVLGGNRQYVHRLVEAGVGVQVGTKLQAYGLQVRHQLVLFEMGGAIKSHVLDHMGQPQLVFVFQNRSGFNHKP